MSHTVYLVFRCCQLPRKFVRMNQDPRKVRMLRGLDFACEVSLIGKIPPPTFSCNFFGEETR